ncbi:RHS repeat-associated core domain-containing protein, partial [Chryseobacterium sp. C39-AII1]|uniref:RHS repeat-associated core domain-containing protein n=1 Tax=Chryseobacterium sp. C39-AII1 TaxID=3080332 RepID=UPI0032086E22
TSEGFYSFRENRYIYQYQDHLGNTRVSFSKTSAGVLETKDTNNYYPFGLNHIGGSNASNFGSLYSYKYNGKELQETGMYDFGARMYMPDLGRWGVVDALAEQMRRYSPYNYAFNNPISYIDPDGNAAYDPRSIYGEHSAFNGDFDPNSSLSSYNGMGGSHGMYFAADAGGGQAGSGSGSGG